MIEDPEPKMRSGSKQGRLSPANSLLKERILADSGRIISKKSGTSSQIGNLANSLRHVNIKSLRHVNKRSIDG
jgi:hypothetical protein